ncbi:YdcF family protein [Sphingomonas nostoxanthinifaciens]|uniref:YdcF family protein n=1 Tax=Sphingomonas nostoxanthinifaciens TaxID=2872652 RepID=UPI001CC1DC2F|nr:YdcF family protein [Sphingomonas nostoxanthinifaciens]UAK25771.1 YdcF family protein [Sphingomonas nostoxanthinifaciens]
MIAGCAVLAIAAAPAGAAVVPDRAMAALAARLFPLLSAWPQSGREGPVATMLTARRQRIAACAGQAPCVLQAARWTDEERDTIAQAASRSGSHAAPDDGAPAGVMREIGGINAVIGVYGQGAPARYPKIDGPDPQQIAANAAAAVSMAEAGRDDPTTALDPSIGLALALLDANDRDEAIAFEPLDARFNAAAMARAKTLDWAHYRYTAIIVPGIGPEDPATPLSALGKLNVRMAAKLWREGRAPFILFSGGTVHPRGTRHAEAIEMAHALAERFGVPENAILVEPYARHTTTNLRNATRRLAALGAPLDRPALISTNPDQSRYIEGVVFAQRNQHELGYQPGRVGARLSPTELEFQPSALSLRVDPMDPLDP